MLQNIVQPGNWIQRGRLRHSEECEWTFQPSITKDMAKEMVVQAGRNLKDFSLRSVKDDVIIFDYFTPTAKWMDQLRIEFVSRGDGQSLVAIVLAKSTGIFPLVVPFATLLSMIFFWVPFKDWGKTGHEIYLLQKEFQNVSKTSISARTTRYSLGNPKGNSKE